MVDFRALCAELVGAIDQLTSHGDSPGIPGSRLILTGDVEALEELADRARAALAEPVEEVIPSDAELFDLCIDYMGEPVASMKAALARYGAQAPQPVPVSERLPGVRDRDAKGRCWFGAPDRPGAVACWDLECEPATDDSHWLPAHALPLPEVEGANG